MKYLMDIREGFAVDDVLLKPTDIAFLLFESRP